jgi:hypothetical protein
MAGRWLKLITTSAVIVLLSSFAVYRQIESVVTGLHIAFAEEQTAIFEQRREQAQQANAVDARGYLEYVVNYYPSGTKQVPGSRLDQVVERSRRGAVREIIASLRSKVHQDFGDDPERWIKKLAPQ